MDDSAVVTPPYVARPLRLLPFRALSLAGARLGDPVSARAFARPYRGVPARLARWQQDGRLWRDDAPGIYLLEYTAGGLTVRGLVGALDVSQRADHPREAAVLPHEGIHPGQSAALARRMEQMQLDPAPILLVHRADQQLRSLLRGLRRSAPALEITDRAEQRHRLWALREPEDLEVVDRALAGARAVIADGHHRYGAYLQLQEQAPGGARDRGLAMLVDQGDTPLFLGPIHRTLGGVTLTQLQQAGRRIGATVEVVGREPAVARLAPGTVVATDGDAWSTLDLPVPADRTTVEALHQVLVPALSTPPREVGYHHSVHDALRATAGGRAVAVLLPAPDLAQLERVVAEGRLLPEKATSFQPKPTVGVLMRLLPDG